MEIYYIITLFIFGATLGSFYNVVGFRLPKGESIVSPPSHCPNCNHQLTFLELFPILSYLFQKGKCKNCKISIPIFYPFFEFLTGALFALSYIIFGYSIELAIALTFVSMTLIIVISDLHYYIIPDEILIVSVILFIIEIFFLKGLNGLLLSLLNGVISFGLMLLLKLFGDFLFKKESMGGGDIKLLFVYGLVLGWEMAVLSIFIGSIVGLPISIALLYLKGSKEENIIPFGPFLSIGALIILFTKIDINTIINLLTIK